MKKEYKKILEELASTGWDVKLRSKAKALPTDVRHRYRWLPDEVRQFIEETDSVVTPDEKTWFITSTELSGDSGSAFSWNQWEEDSLDAAEQMRDIPWQEQIRAFWDDHFTVMMSVKGGYAYFAIRKEDLAIAKGEEPEYEEATEIATSFANFLKMVMTGDSELSRWITYSDE